MVREQGIIEDVSGRKTLVRIKKSSACATSGAFLKLSLLVYILPVVALIAGAFAGGAFAGVLHVPLSLASVIGGFLVMGITFYALKRFDRSLRARSEFRPRMTRILHRVGSLQGDD
ncbi:MAG: SoxR reducing system RseC family protein [Deltaproteobacteria bacterium]|nr:SoxR reducing system RseC family protein [Deltaproteobacteria bacterium]